jgi:hypothetical protein
MGLTAEEDAALRAHLDSPETRAKVEQAQEAEKAAGKPTVIDSAYELTVACSATLRWDGEHTYVIALEDGHVRTLAVRSNACGSSGRVRGRPAGWRASPRSSLWPW